MPWLKRLANGKLARRTDGKLARTCGPTTCLPLFGMGFSNIVAGFSGVVTCPSILPPTLTANYVWPISVTPACCQQVFTVDTGFRSPLNNQPILFSFLWHYTTWNSPSGPTPTHFFQFHLSSSGGFGQPRDYWFYADWPCSRDDMCFPNVAIPISNEITVACATLQSFTPAGPNSCGIPLTVRARGSGGTGTLSFLT